MNNDTVIWLNKLTDGLLVLSGVVLLLLLPPPLLELLKFAVIYVFDKVSTRNLFLGLCILRPGPSKCIISGSRRRRRCRP